MKLRIVAVLAPLGIALAACSATAPSTPAPSSPAPAASTFTSVPRSPEPSISTATSGAGTARGLAEQIAAAINSSDEAAFCADYMHADYRELCREYMPDVHGHMVVHRVVVHGDRALASMTGQVCTTAASDSCQQVTDPGKGMPSKNLTFAQAFAQAVSGSQAADEAATMPLMRVGDRWYLNGQTTGS